MPLLAKLSGVSVLLLAIFGVHAIHHVLTRQPLDSPLMWAFTVLAVAIDLLAFVGGYLLCTRTR